MTSTGTYKHYDSLPQQLAEQIPRVDLSLVIGSGALTLILASSVAFLLLLRTSAKTTKSSTTEAKTTLPKNAGIKTIDREKYPGGCITVYFGTQTGTAESFAKQLQRDAPVHGFFVHVVDLESISSLCDFVERDDDDHGIHRAIFLCATYGEGEPTDNSQKVANMLLDAADIPSMIFDPTSPIPDDEGTPNRGLLGNKLEFCVFGLGNIQYEH
jgi:sulfite reductase alpha subunit-like flavoprotein